MADYDSGCRGKAWIGGAVAGLLVFFFVLAVSHMGFGAAVFLGVLTFLFLGAVFVWAFCSGRGIAYSAPQPAYTPAPAPAPAAPAPAPAPMAAPAAAATPAPAAPAAAPVAPAAPVAAAPLAETVSAPAPAAAVMAPVETAPETAKPAKAAPKRKAEKAAPKAKAEKAPKATKAEAPAETAPKAPKAAPKAADGKPAGLKAPRKGGADDLKLIEGIGPVLEGRLNEWGVFHFDQIAAWGPEEVAYADTNVPRFKGRASRDKWVAQAKIIVSEGVERFLERAKTNDY